MTSVEAIAIAAQVGQTILAGIVTLLLPAMLRWARDQRTRAAFGAVTRAAKVGALIAAAEVRRSLELAAKPGSPGGAAITPEEMRGAIAAGVLACKASIRAQAPRLFDEIVRIYGGERAFDDSMKALVTTMTSNHVDFATGKPAGG